jgi:hypothetical protein
MDSLPLDALLSSRLILVLAGSLLISAGLTGLLKVTLPGAYVHLCCAAIPLGFIGGYLALLGIPPLTLLDPLYFFPYLIGFGIVFGLAIDIFTNADKAKLAIVLLWPAIMVVLIGWHDMPEFSTFAGLPISVMWLSGVIINLWVTGKHATRMAPVIGLFAMAIGLTVVALISGGRILPILGSSLCLAILGFLAWNWPTQRLFFLGTGAVSTGGAVLSLAIIEVLYSEVSDRAIAVLALIIFMRPIGTLLPFGKGQKMGPVMHLVACLIPVMIAAAIAWHDAGRSFDSLPIPDLGTKG